MGYAMAASGRMQYDYKQTNKQSPIMIKEGRDLIHDVARTEPPERRLQPIEQYCLDRAGRVQT